MLEEWDQPCLVTSTTSPDRDFAFGGQRANAVSQAQLDQRRERLAICRAELFVVITHGSQLAIKLSHLLRAWSIAGL